MDMGLGNDVEVRAGQMVSSRVLDGVVNSKVVSGASPGYLER